MALPKLSYPTFEVTIPSTNKTIKMRPFLVREEKILLVAQQTEEPKEVVNAIKQVIVNCSIDQFNVEDLTTFDLEFLFIKLRARSVNSVIKLRYRDNEDNQSYDVECDLDQVEIVRTEGHTNIIQINDNMTMVMKYPRAELMQTLDPSMNESEIFFELLSSCIDEVIENGTHHDARNSTKEEVEEFIASLDVNTFQKIQEFFQTMPKIKHELKYTNSLGHERTVVLDNINDFFTLG
jgi:hypothetical protein